MMTRRISSPIRTTLTILLAAASLTACGDVTTPSGEPTMQTIAGSYRAGGSFGALSFTTTSDGQTVDWLAQGATIELDLDAGGTTAGRLFVPGADEDGGDLDADLVGTWTLVGETVRLSHHADTFLRDMDFTVRNDRLEGDETFSGVRVRTVLARN